MQHAKLADKLTQAMPAGQRREKLLDRAFNTAMTTMYTKE